jgi:hypothetical protein
VRHQHDVHERGELAAQRQQHGETREAPPGAPPARPLFDAPRHTGNAHDCTRLRLPFDRAE